MIASEQRSRSLLTWPLALAAAVGSILLVQHLFLRILSEHFYYETALVHAPIVWFVGTQVVAGLLFLSLFWLIPRLVVTRETLIGMVIFGLLLRLVLFDSIPILEDDFYRYLWDGAVLSHQQNPYELAPVAAIQSGNGVIAQLAIEAGPVFERINYPQLSTIYPPLAQLGFALAHWIEPWSLLAWRGVLLMSDILTVGLLIVLLRDIGRSPLWAAVYWWNPLVTKELINSAHMDALLLPFLLGVVLFVIRRKHLHAACTLALAAGIKIWPVLLLPFALRPVVKSKLLFVGAVLSFIILTLALLSPLLGSGPEEPSGLFAFVRTWEANDALFRALVYLSGVVVTSIGIEQFDGGLVTRVIVAGTLLGLALWLNRNQTHDGQELARRLMLIVAALFLLSPAQFPWYYVWLVPFLALSPSFALLALTAVLPCYYLRFYFDARDQVALFDYGIVWLEYLPIVTLLIVEWFTLRRRTRSEVHVTETSRQSDMQSSLVGRARV